MVVEVVIAACSTNFSILSVDRVSQLKGDRKTELQLREENNSQCERQWEDDNAKREREGERETPVELAAAANINSRFCCSSSTQRSVALLQRAGVCKLDVIGMVVAVASSKLETKRSKK